MKSNSAAKCFLSVVSFLAIAFITGCATTQPVDWNSRVGQYTYAQAVNELGPPNRQIRLSNGQTEFKWFSQAARNDASFSVGGMTQPAANTGMNNNVGAGADLNNRYLQLTFDGNGVLKSWSKNY